MFQDLDLTIRKLLEDVNTQPSLAGVDITFSPPDGVFTFNQKTLDVFLYGVHENRILRDPVPILELVGGIVTRRVPPLRVNCDYLVTAWSKQPGAAGVQEEHLILAAAMIKLSQFTTMPVAYLQNSMVGQPFPVPVSVAQSAEGKSLGEFWSALGQSPRSSFHLMITIAMDIGVSVDEGPPVTTKEIVLHPDLPTATPQIESVFGVGGVVRDTQTAAAIAGADVTLTGRAPTKTDAEGRYRFGGLVAGNYSVTAQAAGSTTSKTKQITVPAAVISDYDIDLSP